MRHGNEGSEEREFGVDRSPHLVPLTEAEILKMSAELDAAYKQVEREFLLRYWSGDGQ